MINHGGPASNVQYGSGLWYKRFPSLARCRRRARLFWTECLLDFEIQLTFLEIGVSQMAVSRNMR